MENELKLKIEKIIYEEIDNLYLWDCSNCNINQTNLKCSHIKGNCNLYNIITEQILKLINSEIEQARKEARVEGIKSMTKILRKRCPECITIDNVVIDETIEELEQENKK